MQNNTTVETVRSWGLTDLVIASGLSEATFEDAFDVMDENEWADFCEDWGCALGIPGCRKAEDRS